MMIERAVRLEHRPNGKKDFTEAKGTIEITDDSRGRVYFDVEGGQGPCIAVDLPDLLKAIQDAILVAVPKRSRTKK